MNAHTVLNVFIGRQMQLCAGEKQHAQDQRVDIKVMFISLFCHIVIPSPHLAKLNKIFKKILGRKNKSEPYQTNNQYKY